MTTAILLALALGLPLDADAEPALRGLDPVELATGREVPGTDAHVRTFGRHTYRFASAANAATFDSDPWRWEIQLGGACGRMGPLSGLGSPERWAVHDGRIYVFASDECRAGFLAAPDRYLDRDDPVPEPAAKTVQAGRAVLGRALDGLGGAAAVDGWETWTTEVVTTYADGDEEREYVVRTAVRFPGDYRTESRWHGGHQTAVSTPDGGFVDRQGAVDEMHPTEWVVHRKMLLRHPLVLLRARELPGFQAVAAGTDEVDGVPVERVTCSYGGATTTLFVAADTGRVVRTAFKGRDGQGAVGYVRHDYSDFRDVGGVALPFRRTSTFDGAVRTPVEYTSMALDADLADGAFARPEGAGD